MAERTGIWKEFILFLKEHKTYWMIPILVVMLLLGSLFAFAMMGGGAMLPWVYAIF